MTGTRAWWLVLLTALAAWTAGGCDRSAPPAPKRAPKPADQDGRRITPASAKPEYSFAADLGDQHPEIVAFLRHFLETCLAGDYAGYRKLCSRRREPETRERFEAVYHALRRLRVEAIEPRPIPELSERVYLVTCSVDFRPESRARLRRKTNRFALLVIREEGTWRILPAPSSLQPAATQPAPTTASAPTTTAPSYPWDADGDF